MQKLEFYQTHLDRVSRSFAFCIRKLDPPFRQWVSLSYLLCRALDTIEDSSWPSSRIQTEQYDIFQDFLDEKPNREKVKSWASRFPLGIPEGELALLADTSELFEDLHGLPEAVRRAIQVSVRQMGQGMKFYSERTQAQQNGLLRLSDLTDVNRYCYFVAGVVGELLSRLYRLHCPEFAPPSDFHQNALHFGLFLQKINLLKDQRKDETEGRYLVPDRRQLLASVRANARGAMDYLLSLPRDEKGYRTFCAWSLFLGAASLPWIEKDFDSDEAPGSHKIPRSVTQELLEAIESNVQDNATLEGAFEQYLPYLPEDNAKSSSDGGQWFRALTEGWLATSEMADLGMI